MCDLLAQVLPAIIIGIVRCNERGFLSMDSASNRDIGRTMRCDAISAGGFTIGERSISVSMVVEKALAARGSAIAQTALKSARGKRPEARPGRSPVAASLMNPAW